MEVAGYNISRGPVIKVFANQPIIRGLARSSGAKINVGS